MTSLTGDGVSVHVIEDVSKAEEDGGGERRAAPEQRVAEFLPRFAGVKVRAGPESGTHAARQSPNLIRAAAALDLTSIALHAHFPARKIQRAGGDADAVEESRVGSGPHLAMAPAGWSGFSRSEEAVLLAGAQERLFSRSYFSSSAR